MNSKNIIIGILLLTTIGGGVYAWQQRQRANDLEDQITKFTAKASSKRSSQRPGGDSQQRSSDSKKSGGDKSQSSDGSSKNSKQGSDPMRAIMQSPKAAPLLASQQRAMMENRYAPLFKTLDLSPEQLAKFKDLLVDKQNAVRDVLTVARQEGLTDRAEIQQLIQQAQADVDNNIAAAIGTDKLAQYQNYDQTAPQRAVVSQVAQRLSYTSEPLSAAQSDQLVALLAQNTPARGNNDGGPSRVFAVNMGGMGTMTFGQGGSVPITGQVIDAAQTFLSPGQVDALRQLQAEQADQQQLQKMLMNNNGGGTSGKSGGTSGKYKGKPRPRD